MTGKRARSEIETLAPPHGDEQDGRPKKRHKTKKHKVKPDSLNWIRKRARTIDRKLQRSQDNLPGDVSVKLQRELAAHSERITQADDKKQRQKMIKRYHMVRFFERKKAARLEKQLREKLATTTDGAARAALEADIHTAEVDRAYAVYFPFMERYVSLYPVLDKADLADADKSSATRALRAERPKLWKTVEAALAKGESALVRLRDRRLANDSHSRPPPSAPSKHSFAAKARGMRAQQERQKRAVVTGSATKRPAEGDWGAMSEDRAKRMKRGAAEDGGDDNDSESDFLEE